MRRGEIEGQAEGEEGEGESVGIEGVSHPLPGPREDGYAPGERLVEGEGQVVGVGVVEGGGVKGYRN